MKRILALAIVVSACVFSGLTIGSLVVHFLMDFPSVWTLVICGFVAAYAALIWAIGYIVDNPPRRDQ